MRIIRSFIKNLITLYKCILNNVEYSTNFYISLNAKIIGTGKKLLLGKCYIGKSCCLIIRGIIKIGDNTKLFNNVTISSESEIEIGDKNVIGDNTDIFAYSEGYIKIGNNNLISKLTRIASANSVVLGNNILMGPHIFIADYNHSYIDIDKAIMFQGNTVPKNNNIIGGILIEDDCWIGTNVVIVGNIHIGKHAVIGANSVVTHDIPPYSVAVGSPAKVVKHYDFKTRQWVKVL